MSPPTNRVSHHLLQAQAIHNEVRAQRDEAVRLLRRLIDITPVNGGNACEQGEINRSAYKLLLRVDSFTKTEGDTQL